MKARPHILKYAAGMYIALVAYFFIIKVLGFEMITELRLFNFIIMLAGLYQLIKSNMTLNTIDYFNNLFLGFRAAALTILMIIVSLFVYITWIDSTFLLVLEHSLGWGKNLGIGQILAAITIEGLSSSFLLSYIIMQYMKSQKLKPSAQ